MWRPPAPASIRAMRMTGSCDGPGHSRGYDSFDSCRRPRWAAPRRSGTAVLRRRGCRHRRASGPRRDSGPPVRSRSPELRSPGTPRSRVPLAADQDESALWLHRAGGEGSPSLWSKLTSLGDGFSRPRRQSTLGRQARLRPSRHRSACAAWLRGRHSPTAACSRRLRR